MSSALLALVLVSAAAPLFHDGPPDPRCAVCHLAAMPFLADGETVIIESVSELGEFVVEPILIPERSPARGAGGSRAPPA